MKNLLFQLFISTANISLYFINLESSKSCKHGGGTAVYARFMGFLTIFLLPQLPGGTHLPPEESCFELRFHLSTVAVLWLVPHISVRCVSGHKDRVCLKNNLTKQLCFELSRTQCAQKEECSWQVTDCAGGVALLVPRDCTKVAKSVLGVT